MNLNFTSRVTRRCPRTTSASLSLLFVLLPLFLLSIHPSLAFGQECWGPPDDMYCPDSSVGTALKPENGFFNMMASAQVGDDVDINSIDPSNFPSICS